MRFSDSEKPAGRRLRDEGDGTRDGRRACRGFCLSCGAWAIVCLGVAAACFSAETRKIVIPFDFASKFDEGRYGRLLGDMVWKKLSREGRFIVPETMVDVRDYCASHGIVPSANIDLQKMRKIVEQDFGAQIGIWGSVERANGAERDAYDLTIKCVDFSTKPPKAVYDATVRTRSVSEIPHVYVQRMLDALSGREAAASQGPDALADENWRRNPNLVEGDFERGANGVPAGWDKRAGQQREPLGGLVQWTGETGYAGNKVIRFTLDKQVAENEGVMYYSDYFPVEENATYRFQCRWRSNGPAVKVFIKCYDHVSESAQRREVYRSQQNLKGPSDAWNTHTESFTPKHTKYAPQWGRVMLYAYLKPGMVEFDDVVLKRVVAASPGEKPKVQRPSSQSSVTIEEMRANERRGKAPD